MGGLQGMEESMNFEDMDQLQQQNPNFHGPNGFSGQVTNQIQNMNQGNREFINNQIIENVSNQVINAQVNRSLNTIMAQYKSKFKKQQVDMIKNECKLTIKSILQQLIDSLCTSNSDKWFSMLGVQTPSDQDLERFLDMVDKTEEIVIEYQQNNVNHQVETARSQQLVMQLAEMIDQIGTIKS